MPAGPYRFCASTFGGFDLFRCPRQLHNAMLPAGQRPAAAAADDVPAVSDTQRGVQYEEKLLCALKSALEGDPTLAATARAVTGDCATAAVVSCETFDDLRGAINAASAGLAPGQTHALIVKDLQIPGEALKEAWGALLLGSAIGCDRVEPGSARPDIVRVAVRRGAAADGAAGAAVAEVTVADIKSAPHAKRYHRLQIALYHYFLGELLAASATPAGLTVHMSKEGEVWLDGSQCSGASKQLPTVTFAAGVSVAVSKFAMEPVLMMVRAFVRTVLPLAAGAPAADIEDVMAPWELRSSCSACDFVERCQRDSALLASVQSSVTVRDNEEDVLCDVPQTAPDRAGGTAATGPLLTPRRIPVFSRHALTTVGCDAASDSAAGAGGAAAVCGAPKKSSTSPCRISVSAPGQRCRFHKDATTEYTCGAPTVSKASRSPCRVKVAAPGERCKHHQEQFRCGAPKAPKDGRSGSPCRMPVLAAGLHCRYHGGTVSNECRASETTVTQPLDDAVSELMVSRALRTDGHVACCVVAVRGDSLEYFAGWQSGARGPFVAREAEQAQEAVQWVKAFATGTPRGERVIVVYDEWQEKALERLIAVHNNAAETGWAGLPTFDSVSQSAREDALSVSGLVSTFARASPRIVCLREAVAAHVSASSPVAWEVMSARQVLTYLMPEATVAALHPFNPRRTASSVIADSLHWLRDGLEALAVRVQQHKSHRVMPPLPPLLTLDARVQQYGQDPTPGHLRANEVVCAALDCWKSWQTRRDRKCLPLVVQCVDAAGTALVVARAEDGEVGRWLRAHACDSASPPLWTDREYLDALQDRMDPVDFTNGNYLVARLGQLDAASIVDATRRVDAHCDWDSYASTKRQYFSHTPQLADITAIARPNDDELRVTVAVLPQSKASLEQGCLYLLCPCANNYNFERVMAVGALDEKNLLWQRCLRGGGEKAHQAHVALAAEGVSKTLTHAQQTFMDTFQGSDTTILWGPPGTGKTTTLAHLLARLCACPSNRGKNVLVTAHTNTALEQVFTKLCEEYPAECDGTTGFLYGCIPGFRATGPLKGVFESRRDKKVDKKLIDSLATHCRVFFTTVWKAAKLCGDIAVDVLIIDEGSQLPVCHAMLAASCLRQAAPGVRVVVAGDKMQLPPILSPHVVGSARIAASPHQVVYAGSVLEALQRHDSVPVVMLDTSYRSVGAIVTRVGALYGDRLRTGRGEAADANAVTAVVSVLPTSLEVEAAAVKKIVAELLAMCSHGAKTVGVVTPHRRQKRVIGAAMRSLHDAVGVPPRAVFDFVVNGETVHKAKDNNAARVVVDVDTVERMQGREYEVVVLALGSVSRSSFVLDLRRLNVATSRARSYLRVVTHKGLLDASGDGDADLAPESLAALEHLRRFIE